MSRKKRRQIVKLGLGSSAQRDSTEVRCDGQHGRACFAKLEVEAGKGLPTVSQEMKRLGWERVTDGETWRDLCPECGKGKPLGWGPRWRQQLVPETPADPPR